MASMLVFGYDKTILQGFAVLAGLAPGSVHFNAHKAYIKDYGYDKWLAALESEFSGVSDKDLATALAVNTGLNKIKLNGDADPENIQLATDFIAANAGNRIGAILQFTEVFSKVSEGVLKPFADDFNSLTQASYAHMTSHETYRAFSSVEHTLSVGVDRLTGSSADDLFKAYIQHNDNTLQSGDILDGGNGEDTLYADIGNSQDFAITAETKGIENVKLRAQAIGDDSKDNNLAGKEVKIDAQRMKDVLNWEDNNSRADLLVEDVRINDNQITKDITITMRETDPGHVDYGLYFDQNSLRNFTNADSQINLRILDTYAVSQGQPNLRDSPYGSFTFWAKATGSTADFVKITLASKAMQDATTLEDMVAALQEAADSTLGTGAVSVSLGSKYIVPDPVSKTDVEGQEIVIKAKGNYTFDTSKEGSGWLATETVPPTSNLYTHYNTAITTDTSPVTSKIVLDYVGRSSTGGDLVVGGLSIGDTSGSKGVQRFEIEVQDDSRLQTISSTNNTLREVTVVNGKTDRVVDAYTTLEKDAGLLRVNGQAPASAVAAISAQLPGGSKSLYGFQDVRLIDGSAMTGKLEFTAELTAETLDKYVKSRSKYLSLEDTQANPLTDDVDVAYTGGANNDKIVVDVDATLAASNSNVKVGMADFNFAFSGGAGNDYISVAVDRAAVESTVEGAAHKNKDVLGFDTILGGDADILKGNTEVWYTNQQSNNMRVYGAYGASAASADIDIEADFSRDKMVISGGAGNDDLRKPGAGDVTIDAGTGADVIYADNTGADAVTIAGNALRAKAGYVFNTANQTVAADPSQTVGDLQSAPLVEVGSWGVKVQVNYRGLTSKVIAIDDTSDFRATQLDINQAIKKAINEDVVLSKLLLAQDDPSGTLIVASKVDDEHVEGALKISFFEPTATELAANANVWQQFVAANPTLSGTVTDNPTMVNHIRASVTTATGLANGYLTTRLGLDDTNAPINGAKSVTTSDNIIKPGTDMDADVIVLGTTLGGDAQASSNDVVKFEGTFGDDTIVNFETSGNGADRLDFRSYFRAAGSDATDAVATSYTHGNALAITGNTVTEAHIEVHTWDDDGTERNDTAAAVTALYTDQEWTATKDDPNVRNELYVAEKYDALGASTGVGVVYHVQDGAAKGDLKVTLLGSIDLASGAGVGIDDSLWDNLSVANANFI